VAFSNYALCSFFIYLFLPAGFFARLGMCKVSLFRFSKHVANFQEEVGSHPHGNVVYMMLSPSSPMGLHFVAPLFLLPFIFRFKGFKLTSGVPFGTISLMFEDSD